MTKSKNKKAASAKETKSRAQSSENSKLLKYAPYALILLGFLLFINLLSADFVNYDDPDYVTENTFVTGQKSMLTLFTEPTAGNYHPLTMLSLRVDYILGDGSPRLFHLVNLLLHLMNTLLLYFFFFRFSNKNRILSLLVAAFFLIHPAHVEAVAWISSRKDVLYAFFFILGMIAYLNSKKENGKTWILPYYVLFVLALLSKPSAAVFPLILIAIDFYQRGSINKKSLLEKLPLVALSAGFLFVTWQIQQDSAVDSSTTIVDNLGFAGMATLKYFVLAIAPINLSVLHPYPPEAASLIYLLSILVVLAAIIWFYTKKKMALFFGLSFFLICLLLVLQFVAVGKALIAERYTYLAYVGLFFIPAYYAGDHRIGKGVQVLSVLAIIWFSYLSYQRTLDWQNSKKLWTTTINSYPENWYAYFGRGAAFQEDGLLVEAVRDLTEGLKYKPGEERLLLMRGRAFALNREHQNALKDLNLLLETKPKSSKGYIARGKVYFESGKPSLARLDFNKAIDLGEQSPLLFTNLGSAYASENRMDSAIYFYKEALSMNLVYTEAHINLANAFNLSNRKEEALASLNDYLKAGGAKNSRYHYTSALVKLELQQFDAALKNVENAIRISGAFPELISLKGLVFLEMGKTEEARQQAIEAINMAKRMNQPFNLPAELSALL